MTYKRARALDTGYRGLGTRWTLFECPYCRAHVKCYAWSLAGSGKKCECGAMFLSHGVREPEKEKKK